MSAWPKALHAVAATSLSDATFHSLRTGAVKGLEADGAGCNAWIQLGLIEHSLLDPQFWSIIQTIRYARDCGDHARIRSTLRKLVDDPGLIPDNCITRTLLTRLQTLGWHVTGSGLLRDQLGQFCIFDTCMAEVILRAQWSWQFVIAQQVSRKPGLVNLQFADAGSTRHFVSTLAVGDQALFHKCLNGCHITQDGKAHCQEEGSNLCPFCDCTDSRYHRFWICERFALERAGVAPDILALVPSLPEFLTGYGWSLKPHTLHSWYSLLGSFEARGAPPIDPQGTDVHVFTDGSCLNQSFPTCRVAAWAVVLAPVGVDSLGQVVDSGPLPGLLQSACRAEIFAI